MKPYISVKFSNPVQKDYDTEGVNWEMIYLNILTFILL
jgi:hypothetical protein